MLGCHACLRRNLRTLTFVDPLASNAPAGVRQSVRGLHNAWRLQLQLQRADDVSRRGPVKWEQSGELKKRRDREHAVIKSPPQERRHISPSEANLKRELEWLPDPVKLADRVLALLKQDKPDKAEALVHLASKQMDCPVSWNHIIEYYMNRGHIKDAFSKFNDMKRRGQKPEAITHLLLLRGLGDYAHFPNSLGRALSLYHSMDTPASRVKPNIIHSNAVLRVCARSNDMDATWGIVAKLPEKGPGSPNAFTYTTIINQLRSYALLDAPSEQTAEESARRRETMIVEGRKLWHIIVQRSQRGDVMIDEALVCAMGRLLLIGARPRDWDDVLSLVQQTMNIPRLVPRLWTAAREASGVPRIRASHTPDDMKNDAAETDTGDFRPGSEFDAPAPVAVRPRKAGHRLHAAPSRNTLSLILESCLKTVAKAPAADYWALLTDTDAHAIRPDLDNCHMYLRVLRQARASADALALVRDTLPAHTLTPQPKTFRIALSTCLRDKRNPHALDHATALLAHMQATLPAPDVKALSLFAELAAHSDDAHVHARALATLDAALEGLRSVLNFGAVDSKWREMPARGDSVDLLRRTVGLYDRAVASGQLERETVRVLQRRRGRTAAYVARLMARGADADAGAGADVEARTLRPSKRTVSKARRREHEQRAAADANPEGLER